MGLGPVSYKIGLEDSGRLIAVNRCDPIRPIEISIAEDGSDAAWPIEIWITNEIRLVSIPVTQF